MDACIACSKSPESVGPLHRGLCNNCRTEHAIPPRTEPQRPRIPCSRCNGSHLVRCRTVRERGYDRFRTRSHAAPLAATYALKRNPWTGMLEVDFLQPIGLIEAYICRNCGFTELYTQRPGDIPVHELAGTEEFEVGSSGPYR